MVSNTLAILFIEAFAEIYNHALLMFLDDTTAASVSNTPAPLTPRWCKCRCCCDIFPSEKVCCNEQPCITVSDKNLKSLIFNKVAVRTAVNASLVQLCEQQCSGSTRTRQCVTRPIRNTCTTKLDPQVEVLEFVHLAAYCGKYETCGLLQEKTTRDSNKFCDCFGYMLLCLK